MRHKHLLQTLAVIALAGLFWVVVTTRSWGGSVEWTNSYSPISAVDGQQLSAEGTAVSGHAPVGAPPDCPEAHPNPSWVDFWGEESTLDGLPLPVGAMVRAYDPTGTLAGCRQVRGEGYYGLAVYQDESNTPELDEGAGPGDRIAFTVDDHPAAARGPDEPLWARPYDLMHVELRASTLAGDFDGDCRVDVADIQRVAARWGIAQGEEGYYPPYDPDGDGVDMGDIQQAALAWRETCP